MPTRRTRCWSASSPAPGEDEEGLESEEDGATGDEATGREAAEDGAGLREPAQPFPTPAEEPRGDRFRYFPSVAAEPEPPPDPGY